jgi:chromosome segregation ATPase
LVAKKEQFYKNFPGLRKYEAIAETRSAASEVERDMKASRNDPTSSSAADQGEFSKSLGEAQARRQSLQQDVGGLRNELRNLNTEVGKVDQDFSKAQVDRQQIERTSASSLEPLSPIQPQIPDGWVPCTCPPDHPRAGIFVNGTQYHTPVLQCPKK